MRQLTFSMENYLEAIFELSRENTGVRVSDIAERLGVTKASTHSAMATLAEKGLIVNEKYREIFLTPQGRQIAETTSRKHQLIQRFLVDVLNVSPNTADKDACAIEHVISNESIAAMEKALNRKQ